MRTERSRMPLQTALKIDPKNAESYGGIGPPGAVCEAISVSAQKWLEAALDLDPQLVEARGNLAMVKAKKGDLGSAEKLLRQGIEDDPQYKEGHLNLGLILAQQGRISDADQELDKAVALAATGRRHGCPPWGKAKAQMGMSSDVRDRRFFGKWCNWRRIWLRPTWTWRCLRLPTATTCRAHWKKPPRLSALRPSPELRILIAGECCLTWAAALRRSPSSKQLAASFHSWRRRDISSR